MEDYKLTFNKEGEMVKVPKDFIVTRDVFITQNCDRQITGCFGTLKEISEKFSYIELANLDNLKSKEYNDIDSTEIDWDLFITKCDGKF